MHSTFSGVFCLPYKLASLLIMKVEISGSDFTLSGIANVGAPAEANSLFS